jgi:hypothetical protein
MKEINTRAKTDQNTILPLHIYSVEIITNMSNDLATQQHV